MLFLGIAGAIIVVFLSLHYTAVAAMNPGNNMFDNVFAMATHIQTSPFDFKGATAAAALPTILIIGVIYALAVFYFLNEEKRKEHIDPKIAQGSSDWNTDYKTFKKKFAIMNSKGVPTNMNMILGKDLYFGLVPGRNVNVVIMGSAGSGKSFGVIKPNLLQMNTSFVVTDPSGEIFRSEAKMLMENGYNVKIFSTSNMANSNCYNPFDYVYDEEGNVDETRVASMINMFMANATDLQQSGKGDKFWDQSSKALLNACAMLLLDFFPPETHNMYHMLKLVQKGKVSESRSDDQTELGKIFEAARAKNPESHCFSSYDTFTLAPAKTANSILISAAVDLNMFNQTKVRNMTTTAYQVKSRNLEGKILHYRRDANGMPIPTDENIDIRTVGDEKTAIFINIPQADGTFNFLVSMLYAQLFESLYGRAEKICPKKWMIMGDDKMPLITMLDSEEEAKKVAKIYSESKIQEEEEHGRKVYYLVNPDAGDKYTNPAYNFGCIKKLHSKEVAQKYIDNCKEPVIEQGKARLPWHVQCLLDEFSNIGSIPEFPQKLATMRKYEISCMIVLQSLSQLKNRYDKLWPDILSNCDSTIFLGTSDPDTCEYISKRLGPKTVRVVTHGSSNSGKGKSGSSNESYQKRELMTPDEVSRIPNNKSIVLVNGGGNPFFVTKYKALDHPNWNHSGDVDPKMRIEPTEYTVCKEKASSKSKEEEALKLGIENAANGKTADGKPAVASKTIRSGADLSNVTNGVNPKRRPIGGADTYFADEAVPM